MNHHLQPLTQKIKSFRKYITLFLCKIQSISKLSKGTVLCTVKGVGLYPNILHTKRIALFWDSLDKRTEKQVSTDMLLELGNIFKNNVLQFDAKTLRQMRETTIGNTLALRYTIIFMTELDL